MQSVASTRRSAFWMAVASVLFAVMAALAKRATARLPGPEVAFFRFAVGIVACLAVATGRPLVARNRLGLLLRGAFGGAAVLLYFLAIAHLPVGIATLLNYTAPVFTAIWAALFLREPLGVQAIGALALTTTGVALVILGSAPPGTLGVGTWQMVGICSAVLSGAAVATIREVRKTDGTWEIFGAFCLVGALVTGAPMLHAWVRPARQEWLYLMLVGMVSVLAQILMTHSLRYLRAAVGGILMQLTPVSALVLGYFVYGERPPALALFGASVTFVGVTYGGYLAAGPSAMKEIMTDVVPDTDVRDKPE